MTVSGCLSTKPAIILLSEITIKPTKVVAYHIY